MINEELNKNYSLKVLFGPMFGCELQLPEHDYFLIINPASSLQDKNSELVSDSEHAAYYTTSTLYIPCDIASPNISLHLSACNQDDEGVYFDIEIHDENGNNYKSSLRENDIFIHEHIKLAIKQSDKEWSEDIKNYHALQFITADENDNSQKIANKKRLATVLVILLVGTILLCLSIFAFNKISADQHIISLSEALSGAPAPLEVVKGRENKNIYILAHKSREMEWAKEAIHKMNNQDNLLIILLNKKKIDIIENLSKIGYPVLQFDYNSPLHPVLAIYRSLTPQEEIDLSKIVLKKIPYALSIDFVVKTKEQLVRDARQGLDRLNIHYRLINTSTGYSLVIRDSLSDHTLNSLYEFINNFTEKWGNIIVTFSINLDENWLQNKSYVDSTKGYLFLNPRHWYFPLNNKDF
ncbi:PrgH/EprH family type III secretion apparatus protein [Klebsiella sp. BIGb0407]|uniref:PrgH/EprH family type III secretion apparatus protein n=1 Tax=Klebsiella sp. BIGb0407 TaxID=2940603 RepID=UPI002168B623|nr:PrgH/EprH family type III secretion apparatus protein [Klebsiella sp. BIGb0407]MCS3431552.1 type III secretion system PrgH/EprH family protein [Klebsiella sp. BIGb0407]